MRYSIDYLTKDKKKGYITAETNSNEEICYLLAEVLKRKKPILYLEISARELKQIDLE